MTTSSQPTALGQYLARHGFAPNPGNTAWLGRYVGREVEIDGKPTVITLDTTAAKAASTVEELPALDVKSAKELAKTCTSRTP